MLKQQKWRENLLVGLKDQSYFPFGLAARQLANYVIGVKLNNLCTLEQPAEFVFKYLLTII